MSRAVRNLRLFGDLKPSNPSRITEAQRRLFFSEGSPLSKHEKEKLRRELRRGKVTVVSSKEDL